MITDTKCLVVDLDGTLCPIKTPDQSYADLPPIAPMVEQLRHYHAQGFRIIIHTARNMRSHSGNIGKINAKTLPVIIDWLTAHNIPFDEVHVGKPWCGKGGFYVDDKAIRPDEFLKYSYGEILALVGEAQHD